MLTEKMSEEEAPKNTCGPCREMYAEEHLTLLIKKKQRELDNLIILRGTLPSNPSYDVHRAVRELFK